MHTFCGVWPRFKSTQNLAIFTIKPMTATTKNLICKCVAMIFSRSSIFAFSTAPIKSNFMSARRFFFFPLTRFPIFTFKWGHTIFCSRLERVVRLSRLIECGGVWICVHISNIRLQIAVANSEHRRSFLPWLWNYKCSSAESKASEWMNERMNEITIQNRILVTNWWLLLEIRTIILEFLFAPHSEPKENYCVWRKENFFDATPTEQQSATHIIKTPCAKNQNQN